MRIFRWRIRRRSDLAVQTRTPEELAEITRKQATETVWRIMSRIAGVDDVADCYLNAHAGAAEQLEQALEEEIYNQMSAGATVDEEEWCIEAAKRGRAMMKQAMSELPPDMDWKARTCWLNGLPAGTTLMSSTEIAERRQAEEEQRAKEEERAREEEKQRLEKEAAEQPTETPTEITYDEFGYEWSD